MGVPIHLKLVQEKADIFHIIISLHCMFYWVKLNGSYSDCSWSGFEFFAEFVIVVLSSTVNNYGHVEMVS